MKSYFVLSSLGILLIGCTSNLQSERPLVTATVQVTESFPIGETIAWNIYDPSPDHLWNRVFRQLYRRTSLDGTEYGSEELDPLLWFDTTYL